jgi:hypothetical protein
MRIHQLPIGTRFEYDGQEYVKTGPLVGTGSAGQRLIPKHAVLRPLGDVDIAPAAAPSATVLRVDVLRAFETFYAQCMALLPETQRPALASAREGFLKALDG